MKLELKKIPVVYMNLERIYNMLGGQWFSGDCVNKETKDMYCEGWEVL